MKNALKLVLLSAAMMIAFNSFAGPITAEACDDGKTSACNKTSTGVGVHGAAAAVGASKKAK